MSWSALKNSLLVSSLWAAAASVFALNAIRADPSGELATLAILVGLLPITAVWVNWFLGKLWKLVRNTLLIVFVFLIAPILIALRLISYDYPRAILAAVADTTSFEDALEYGLMLALVPCVLGSLFFAFPEAFASLASVVDLK